MPITLPKTVTILPQNRQLLSAMTTLRNRATGQSQFDAAFEKVARQLMIAALDYVPLDPYDVYTPLDAAYNGSKFSRKVCGVSILRAGASMEDALRKSYDGPLSFGKILIQRDESTCLPNLLYSKLPKGIEDQTVLILEPMLATGGSASKAIEVLLEKGIREESLIFVNLLASEQGLHVIQKRFPNIHIITAAVDSRLTPSGYIEPGLGDFGDRFYGTLD